MSFNIPSIGLPGSVGVTDPPTSVIGAFPNLWKPVDGGWTVTVPIHTDTNCPVQVLVELIRTTPEKGTVTLASQTCMASSTPSTCTLTVSDTAGIVGRDCSIAGLGIRVTPSQSTCPDPGAPAITCVLTGSGGCSKTIAMHRDSKPGSANWRGSIFTTVNGPWPLNQVIISLSNCQYYITNSYYSPFGGCPGGVAVVPCLYSGLTVPLANPCYTDPAYTPDCTCTGPLTLTFTF